MPSSSSFFGGIIAGKTAASATKCCPNGSCDPICQPIAANCCPPPCCEAIFAGGTTTFVTAGLAGICLIGCCIYAYCSNQYRSKKDMQQVSTTDPLENQQTNTKQPGPTTFNLQRVCDCWNHKPNI